MQNKIDLNDYIYTSEDGESVLILPLNETPNPAET